MCRSSSMHSQTVEGLNYSFLNIYALLVTILALRLFMTSAAWHIIRALEGWA
jgi:hypothetical protein